MKTETLIDKEKNTTNNAESLKQIKTQIEQYTNELVKEIYKNRDHLKNEIKTTESNLKKKLSDQVTKDRQQTDKLLNEAKKSLTDNKLKEKQFNKLIGDLNVQNEDLERAIEMLITFKSIDYEFKPNENTKILENFLGTIKKISTNDPAIRDIDLNNFISKSKRSSSLTYQELANRYYLKGLTYVNNEWKKAIKFFDEAILIDPNFYEPIETKANYLLDIHEIDEALKCFEKLIQIDSNLINGYIGKSTCLAALEKFNEALEVLNKILKNDSKNYAFIFKKACVLCQMKNFEKSIELFDQAIQINPTAECYLKKGFAYYNMDKFALAITCFKKAKQIDPNVASQALIYAKALVSAGKYSECVTIVDESIKLVKSTETKRDLLILKGQSLHEMNRLNEAIETLELAHHISKNNSATEEFDDPLYQKISAGVVVLMEKCKLKGGTSSGYNKKKLDNQLTELGIKLANIGINTPQEETKQLQQETKQEAEQLYNEEKSLKINLGWFKHDLKKDSNSIFLLEGSQDYDSIEYIKSKTSRISLLEIRKKADKHIIEAIKYLKQNRTYEANEQFDKAIQTEPNFYEANEMKAMALFEDESFQESLKYFNKLIQIDPKLREGHTGKGMCLAALGKYQDSIEHFNRALQINKSNYVAIFHKGRVLLNLGNYSESIELFNQAIEISETAECYGYKACSLFHLKEYEKSIRLFKKAFFIEPNDQNLHRHLNLYTSAHFYLENYWECIRCVDDSNKKLMKPDQVSSLMFIKAQSYYKLRKFQDAVNTLNSAIDILNDDHSEETPQILMANKILILKIKDLIKKCEKNLK